MGPTDDSESHSNSIEVRTRRAPDLLGHASLQTTQKHYILARGTRAHQAVQKSISDARHEARQRLGQDKRRNST